MGGLPQFISFGEALTDLIRRGEDSWVSVPGGAPWNVARVMACFGVSSAFGGAIGRDCFSDVLYRASEQAGLDLRFLQQPVLCGHYRGDPIAAAEGVIDRHLVNGALSHRQRLGIHSGELGNATIVLMPRNREERRRHSGCGAVVVGLGEMGHIDADGVTQAVRAGVLRYLLHAADRSILAVFVIEITLRLAVYRLTFFRDPWSIFDFVVVAIALVPASGPLAVLRALRVLRDAALLGDVRAADCFDRVGVDCAFGRQARAVAAEVAADRA